MNNIFSLWLNSKSQSTWQKYIHFLQDETLHLTYNHWKAYFLNLSIWYWNKDFFPFKIKEE